MVIRISRAAYVAMLAEAAADPAREVCGLLLGREDIERIVPARNMADDPTVRFEIDPAVLFAAIRRERVGDEIMLGYYHSHPAGPAEPSECDRVRARGDQRLWIIVARQHARAWRMTQAGQFEALALQVYD